MSPKTPSNGTSSHPADLALDRRTVAEQIAGSLRDAIRSGDLLGGTELSQVELAKRFGVSRVPVREALRALEGERWVRAPTHHRVVVQDLSIPEMMEAFELRALLETHLLERSVSRMDDSHVRLLHASCDEMEALEVHADWVKANQRFHAQLMSCAESSVIMGVIDTVSSQVERYLRQTRSGPDRRSEANQDHRCIVEAVGARDVDRAKALLSKHIARTCQLAIAVREEREKKAAADI